jgi:hypothetical protein
LARFFHDACGQLRQLLSERAKCCVHALHHGLRLFPLGIYWGWSGVWIEALNLISQAFDLSVGGRFAVSSVTAAATAGSSNRYLGLQCGNL